MVKIVKLYNLIIKSAETGVNLQAENGSMPQGNNGPWGDPDTPVRNTAHWLITFLKAYELTGKNKFKKVSEKAANYLISKEVRPMNQAFWCRKDPKTNLSNGLIGQAWVIEALALATKFLKNPEYGKVAEEVFLLHPFDYKLGLWRFINVDGSHMEVHQTFNQQLWFATCGLLLTKSAYVQKNIALQAERFLERLEKNIDIHRSGLINHQLARRIYKGILRKLIFCIMDLKERLTKTYKELSVGYHSFNLYAFALLRKECNLNNYKFWNSNKFKKMLNYVLSKDYKRKIIGNKYTFSYNPTGFEIAFALDTFSDIIQIPESEIYQWVHKQMEKDYSPLLCKNTSDPKTLAARIYEATRLSNIDIKVFILKKYKSK